MIFVFRVMSNMHLDRGVVVLVACWSVNRNIGVWAGRLRKYRYIFNDDAIILNFFLFLWSAIFSNIVTQCGRQLLLLDLNFLNVLLKRWNFCCAVSVCSLSSVDRSGRWHCFLSLIVNDNSHPLHSALPTQCQPVCRKRHNAQFSARVFQ